LLACLNAAPLAAQETVPTCKGRNIYDDLKTTDPAGYAEVGKVAAAELNSGPLYWKITPVNGAKPSYLLGTAHVTDERIAQPSKTIVQRMAKSRVAVFELSNVGDRRALGAAIMSEKTRTEMPAGQTLWDVIPDDREAALRANPLIAKIPAERLQRLQPWLLMMIMSSPLCEQIRQETKFVLDAALSQTAQIYRLDIEGLETVAEQLDVMSSLSLKEQVDMLVKQGATGIPVEDTFQTLADLYVTQRVTVMQPLMLYLGKKKGISPGLDDTAFMAAFISKRNVNMATRSQKYIDKGAAFIAVGALHLYGEDGVVELLRNAGNKVEPAP
jgi:uncharacterized protein